jgi:hypothetical protein
VTTGHILHHSKLSTACPPRNATVRRSVSVILLSLCISNSIVSLCGIIRVPILSPRDLHQPLGMYLKSSEPDSEMAYGVACCWEGLSFSSNAAHTWTLADVMPIRVKRCVCLWVDSTTSRINFHFQSASRDSSERCSGICHNAVRPRSVEESIITPSRPCPASYDVCSRNLKLQRKTCSDVMPHRHTTITAS